MNKQAQFLTAGLATLGLMFSGMTTAGNDPFHAAPFDFLFGNHIDTHQRTATRTGDTGDVESLYGRFYIMWTGNYDPVSGLPIARHPRGLASDGSHDERCWITVPCPTGWIMKGIPGAAKFVSHSGVNGDDHPLWLVNRAEETTAPATGMVIPQPGSYTHFHWITSTSTDPRAPYVSPECDKKNAGELQTGGPSAVDFVCQGWFLEIRAVTEFAFEHGGEIIPVRLGFDNRTHLNLLTNFNNDVVITNTR
jgi:hypothetical protein